MIKVGVIGLGPIGNRHARLYSEMENAELLGVCDIDRVRADQAAKDYDTRAFYSVREMVEATGLDMVSVTTGGVEYGSDHYQPT
ncbi:MAG: putative dehydrogenase, partial [Planctomycetota bacterium]